MTTTHDADQFNHFSKARQAEIDYHNQFYRETPLYKQGSWLAKPVQSVMDAFSLMSTSQPIQVLDLGSGVGRNSIPMAHAAHLESTIVCVDLLDNAITLLAENAEQYGVEQQIKGIIADVEQYPLLEDSYHFVVACSCLEHLSSEDIFVKKLTEIRNSTKDRGINCILLNTDALEQNCETGERWPALLELNLSSTKALTYLNRIYDQAQWELITHTANKQEIKEFKNNEHILLTGTWLTYIVRKR